MHSRIIVAAPPGPTRVLLEDFLSPRCEKVTSLAREQLASLDLVIEDSRVALDGEEILDDATAAVILDSGYMWPMPMLDPSPQQWEEHRGRYDDYLRDERESASFWYSLMEMVSERVSPCVNPQAAFELGAMKPLAFELLREAGLPLPPLLTTNDPDAVAAFAGRHEGELATMEPLPGAPLVWLDRPSYAELPLDQAPVILQVLASRETQRAIAVGGRLVAGLDGSLARDVASLLPSIQEKLRAPWAELVFGRGSKGPVLCDFSPSPDLGWLSGEQQRRVLDALWELIGGLTIESS